MGCTAVESESRREKCQPSTIPKESVDNTSIYKRASSQYIEGSLALIVPA